jgi:hypothetical protein
MHAREVEEARLDVRRRRRRTVEAAMLLAAAGAGAVVLLPFAPGLALALAVGAGLEALVGVAALCGYRDRVSKLALDPAAYVLPEVEGYGRRIAGKGQCARLSAWISEILADVHVPGNIYLVDRVLRCAHDLEALARDLTRPGARIEPASAVACKRLLTCAVESPLYNPRLPADELGITVHRIRAGIEL